jgi:hypothetical protein
MRLDPRHEIAELRVWLSVPFSGSPPSIEIGSPMATERSGLPPNWWRRHDPFVDTVVKSGA